MLGSARLRFSTTSRKHHEKGAPVPSLRGINSAMPPRRTGGERRPLRNYSCTDDVSHSDGLGWNAQSH